MVNSLGQDDGPLVTKTTVMSSYQSPKVQDVHCFGPWESWVVTQVVLSGSTTQRGTAFVGATSAPM